MAKRVMIISVKAGAGHMRAAQAVEAAFKERFPQVEVRNIEALGFTNAAFQKSFTGTYEKLSADLPSVWGMIYEKMEAKPAKSKMKKLATLFDRANALPLLAEVKAFGPDAIVCTHYLPAEVLAPRRRKGKLAAPVYVVLTDYDIHTMWIQDGVDGYFVATGEMAYALDAKGVGNARVVVTGIPVMPEFARRYPGKPEMRRNLGLRTGAPTVLVSAGGFAAAGVEEAIGRVADAAEGAQLLVVAGRTESLKKVIDRVASKHRGRVVPYGFITNMNELMAASDFAVTKSGGLTSSECLAMGLPMVIWNPIPGQEERNSDYLLENGAALRANSLAHLVFKVRRLLGDSALLARMQDAARRIARPNAAFEIAQRVMER